MFPHVMYDFVYQTRSTMCTYTLTTLLVTMETSTVNTTDVECDI